MQEYRTHRLKDVIYFLKICKEKIRLDILKPCRVVGKDLKKVSEKVSLSRTLKYFQ